MSETLTSNADDVTADIPEYPMDRDARCPFAPPPQMLKMNETKPLSRVRIWDGSTPWLITGHEVARELFADSRVSVDDRLDGFPHWNEHMLSTVHKRPRSVFTSDAEEHTRFRRMLSKPFTFKRVEGLRPVIQEVTDQCIDAILAGPAARRSRHETRTAGAHPGDQRHARRPIRRSRVLPAPRERRAGPLRHRRGRAEGRDEPPPVPDRPRQEEDGASVRKMPSPTWPSASTRARSASRRLRSWAPGC